MRGCCTSAPQQCTHITHMLAYSKHHRALQGGGAYMDGCISELLEDNDFTNSIVSAARMLVQNRRKCLEHVLLPR
jgi:hypothetical protein